MTDNWRGIARSMEEAELVCPNCHTRNAPGALLVHLDDTGVAGCEKCGHAWTVNLNPKGSR